MGVHRSESAGQAHVCPDWLLNHFPTLLLTSSRDQEGAL